jgi:hypothetical protein
MMPRRSALQHCDLLNPEGQRRLLEAYNRRVRRRGSFGDYAFAYLCALQDEGQLDHYRLPGIDPFAVLTEFSS